MKKIMRMLFVVMLTVLLISCGDGVEETISQAEHEKVVSELSSENAELQRQLESMQTELESMQAEFDTLKFLIEETKSESETGGEEATEIKGDEGLTVATDPVIVPDPSTQSEFVLELTAENFMSVLEVRGASRYDAWGEYFGKVWGFSSLLYEQGWALGKVEDFAVEYSLFGEEKRSTRDLIGSKSLDTSWLEENANPNLRVYRVKGTLTFYPIEDVGDEVHVSETYDLRYIDRTLPDGSEITLYTDKEGTIVY